MSETTRPAPETRQKAIDALCDSFARDGIEIDDLEKRLELVHEAETEAELGLIVADLPTSPVAAPVPEKREGAVSMTTPDPSSSSPDLAPRPTLPEDRIPAHSVIVGIMGGGSRRGTWIPARRNWAVGLMGGCELDFRDAQLGPGVTEVRVLALMGGIEIIAPPDVQVESSGIGIMGGFDISSHYRAPIHPDAPIIRITGLAIMGAASVKVRYPGETARDARHRLKAEQKARKLLAMGGEVSCSVDTD